VLAESGITPRAAVTVKYDSSGNLQWQRILIVTDFINAGGLTIDSSSNIYGAFCYNTISDATIRGALFKYNSSGTLQWQVELKDLVTPTQIQLRGPALDSSGNIYVAGLAGSNCLLVKYNSSGVVQWQRTLSDTSFSDLWSATTDTSGNVYAVGRNLTDDTGVIVKYNSSGTLQWQRSLAYSSKRVELFSIKTVGGAMYICGFLYDGTLYEILTLRLPTNGGLTGTYGSYTYASSSLTDAASSYTEDDPGLSEDAGAFTDNSVTLIDVSTSFTSSTTSI
jgi:hypothetical protein